MGTEQQTTQTSSPGQSRSTDSSLLDELIASAKVSPVDEAYSATRQGVGALLAELLAPSRADEKVNAALIDEMIAAIDQQLGRQMDEILHASEFQKLESAWRSLKFLVDRVDFRENNKLSFLSVSKQELLEDFEDAPDITKSSLYKLVYSAEYGQFGGEPYGAMIGNYVFDAGNADLSLLSYIASVATMAHAPFIAAASPRFFGVEGFAELSQLRDLNAVMEGPQYTRWRAFRQNPDARSVGLVLPHFLLRVPYGEQGAAVKSFQYTEQVAEHNDRFLWGNAAFAFADRLADSFAKYRWCANIIGPQGGGTVNNLPLYRYEAMGATQLKIPTEVLITERREFELAEHGFISLTMRKNSDNAAFFSANSTQAAQVFANTSEGKEAESNFKLGTQLPYMFVVNRLAHYIKVIQREGIGSAKERNDIEAELNTWLRQYVADMENPAPGVRSRRPLRQASVQVSDVEGDPGWYRVGLQVRPHFKYMGASFTLSLVGKLDK